jgi:4-amino-4-deoxy-L-arabinose transferase-like glycosyltransferase
MTLDAGRWLPFAVTFGAGLVRLVIGALTPLYPDETYYWEWSRRLAWGYFDHPPAIAWLIRAGTSIGSETPFGVRLFPVVVGTIGSLLICAAARRLAGNRAALLAAVVFAVMPVSAAGLVLATPDAPLLAAAAAVVYSVLRAIEQPARSRESLRWWCIAGAALGIALCSKYTAVLVPLGVLVALGARRELRARLFEPGPYAATAIALLVFLPVVVWNARHDWVSFAFQLRHGFGGAAGSVLRRELDLVGGQLGLASPILFVMMAIAVARSVRSSPLSSLLSLSSLVIVAFFAYSATRRRVEANWPALAYVPGILLLVSVPSGRAWDKWLRAGIVLSGILTLVAYANAFVPVLPVPARRDPVARSAGWDDLARAVDRIYSARRLISSYRTLVGADRYQDASELAFHLPNHPEVFALNLTSRANQYDLWPSFPDRARPRDGLILVVDDVVGTHRTVELLTPHFATVRQGEQVALARAGDVVKNLRVWILDGWRGTWPPR